MKESPKYFEPFSKQLGENYDYDDDDDDDDDDDSEDLHLEQASAWVLVCSPKGVAGVGGEIFLQNSIISHCYHRHHRQHCHEYYRHHYYRHYSIIITIN